MWLKAARATTRRANPNAGTEGAELREGGALARMEPFKGRGSIAFARKCILDANVVVEGVGPKTGIKMGSQKHGAKSITDGLMSAFAGTILMRRVSAGGMDGIMKFFEEGANFGIVVELASLVKNDVFVINVRGMGVKPFSKPKKRRALGDTGDAVESGSVVVGDEDVTCFAVDTSVGVFPFCVLGGLSSEGKINTEALPRDCCFTRRVVAARLLAEFGGDASWT
jgi:hypothetical protein